MHFALKTLVAALTVAILYLTFTYYEDGFGAHPALSVSLLLILLAACKLQTIRTTKSSLQSKLTGTASSDALFKKGITL